MALTRFNAHVVRQQSTFLNKYSTTRKFQAFTLHFVILILIGVFNNCITYWIAKLFCTGVLNGHTQLKKRFLDLAILFLSSDQE